MEPLSSFKQSWNCILGAWNFSLSDSRPRTKSRFSDDVRKETPISFGVFASHPCGPQKCKKSTKVITMEDVTLFLAVKLNVKHPLHLHTGLVSSKLVRNSWLLIHTFWTYFWAETNFWGFLDKIGMIGSVCTQSSFLKRCVLQPLECGLLGKVVGFTALIKCKMQQLIVEPGLELWLCSINFFVANCPSFSIKISGIRSNLWLFAEENGTTLTKGNLLMNGK